MRGNSQIAGWAQQYRHVAITAFADLSSHSYPCAVDLQQPAVVRSNGPTTLVEARNLPFAVFVRHARVIVPADRFGVAAAFSIHDGAKEFGR